MDDKRADTVAADHYPALLQPRKGFADRRPADVEPPAQIGFGRQHAVLGREIAALNSGENFVDDLLSKRDVSADHANSLVFEWMFRFF
jgi:hypothetical protein